MWHRRVNAHREETDPLHWVDALNRPACGLAWQQRWRGGFIWGAAVENPPKERCCKRCLKAKGGKHGKD